MIYITNLYERNCLLLNEIRFQFLNLCRPTFNFLIYAGRKFALLIPPEDKILAQKTLTSLRDHEEDKMTSVGSNFLWTFTWS